MGVLSLLGQWGSRRMQSKGADMADSQGLPPASAVVGQEEAPVFPLSKLQAPPSAADGMEVDEIDAYRHWSMDLVQEATIMLRLYVWLGWKCLARFGGVSTASRAHPQSTAVLHDGTGTSASGFIQYEPSTYRCSAG